MVICTIATRSYLPAAVNLARRVRHYHPEATLALGLVETSLSHPCDSQLSKEFDVVVLASEVRPIDFCKFAFRHIAVELCTAIKPSFLSYLFRHSLNDDVMIYLDPDIDLHSRLDDASRALDKADILVTPHFLTDSSDPADIAEHQLAVLRCGIYNLGFLGLRRSAETRRFLEWWEAKLEWHCYVDQARGLFVDQKWIDLAVCFHRVGVLRHPGYNVAHWNMGQRVICATPHGYTVLGEPLCFVHFSQAELGKDVRTMGRHAKYGLEPIHMLRRNYLQRVRSMRRELQVDWRWSYDYFHSGEPIAFEARKVCRLRPEALRACTDPYQESNAFFLST